MAKRKSFTLNKDLQNGLFETMSAVKQYSGDLRYEVVPLSKIELDPDNPRDLALNFSDLPNGPDKDDPLYERKISEIKQISTLAETISHQGLINPVVVFKLGDKYRLVAGERRCLASVLACKTDIKANILHNKPTEYKQRLLQWIENIEREDLSLWERLQNIKMILNAYQKNNSELAQINPTLIKNILCCSVPQATHYYHVLNGDEALLKAVEARNINNLEKAALIAKVQSATVKQTLIKICQEGASLRQLKEKIKQDKQATQEKDKENLKAQLSKGRGRKSPKINLGSVNDSKIIKTIIEAVLEQNEFHDYHKRFEKINWDNSTSVQLAFKELLDVVQLVKTR